MQASKLTSSYQTLYTLSRTPSCKASAMILFELAADQGQELSFGEHVLSYCNTLLQITPFSFSVRTQG